jgi:hypothetical protein
MAKKKSKSVDYLGMGIIWALGLILGLVLFGVLYGWYLTGFSDSTTVLTTAILLIIVIWAIWYVVLIFTKKKYADAYHKAVWFGIGLMVAFLIAGFILAYFGLSASLSVGTLVLGRYASHMAPRLTYDPKLLRQQTWIQ